MPNPEEPRPFSALLLRNPFLLLQVNLTSASEVSGNLMFSLILGWLLVKLGKLCE